MTMTAETTIRWKKEGADEWVSEDRRFRISRRHKRYNLHPRAFTVVEITLYDQDRQESHGKYSILRDAKAKAQQLVGERA